MLAMVVNASAYLLDKRSALKSIAGKPRSYHFRLFSPAPLPWRVFQQPVLLRCCGGSNGWERFWPDQQKLAAVKNKPLKNNTLKA